MSEDKKVCVVGAGYWGSNHIKTLHELSMLGGLVEKDVDLREKAKNKFPEIKIFSDLSEALDSDLFLGFTVATPAATHFSLAKEILLSGFPVLVEKPFCLNLNDAKELTNIANKKKLCLMVGHLLLFHSAISEIKKIVSQGGIGELRYIYSNRLNLGIVRSYEDVFWSLAPHDISIIQHLCETNPVKVSKSKHSFLNNDIADIQITSLEYPSDLKAHIFSSWYNPFKEHRLVICGSNGFIDYKASDDEFFTVYKSSFESLEIENKLNVDEGKRIFFEKNEPLKEELSYFINNIRNEKLAEIAGPKSALETTKIMLSIEEN
jgi:UDP-2-acetamido-3-amino-2,3-dideoxy-glucuronate N-acetyltransferase